MTYPMVSLYEIARPTNRPVEVSPGSPYRTIGVKWWGEGAYERATIDGSQTAAKTLSLVREDDLIINKIWVRHGSTAIASKAVDGCAASGEFPTFELDRSLVLPRWIHWLTKTRDFWYKCDALSRGSSGKNRIKPELFLTIKIPIPLIDEQRRIVAKIEQLAAKIEEAKRLRQQTADEVQSLLASASEAAFKQRSGWTEARVVDFCDSPQYGFTASATNEQVGPRLLRITDIQEGKVNWDTVPFCECPRPEQYLLQKNDLVFARTGATTGKSFVIDDCPNAVFASYLIRLRVRRLVTVTYLYRFFQTPSYWSQITDQKKGTGQPNVNGKKLANIRVPIASPEEQRRIVAYLDSLQAKVDRLKALQAQTAAELEALLPSILDQAFKGEL